MSEEKAVAKQDPSQEDSCSLLELIDGGFRDAVEKNVHLHIHLHEWFRGKKRLPKYYEQLSRELRKLDKPDIVYPAGDPIFIHIYYKPGGARQVYHVVEPTVPDEAKGLLNLIEEALALVIDEGYDYESREEQEELLRKAIRKAVRIDESLSGPGAFKVVKGRRGRREIRVSREAFEAVEYLMIKEKVGLGVLEPLIKDPYIEDITCDGVGPLFVEHKVFSSCEATTGFSNDEELDEYVVRLSERIGKPVTYRRPIVDATLPDGSRINIVFGRDVSRRGTNFTIRKFSGVPISIVELCDWRTMSFLEAAYLWMLLEEGMSVWVCGETASGKTTTVKAMCTFIRPRAKVVSIEDTPEIVVPHENWTREVTRESDDKEASVHMYDLLKAALRQRPNYIIVGEIRGMEASVAFQAMQTGHPVIATFHAATVEKLIQRLTGSPIEIPKTYIDNLNAVVLQSAVRLPQTGRLERRVLSINEIVGYDPLEGRFNFIELFSWDPSSDEHEFRGEGMSFLLEQKIAVMRGIPERELKRIYDELMLRSEVLELMSQCGIRGYYDVWKAIKIVYEIGLETARSKLKREGRLW